MEKISGFSLVRNGVKFDYPFIESLRSLLPLVDELVLNVGEGDDETLQVCERFAANEGKGKVKIFTSIWPLNDPEKKKSGLILSEQTNLALDRCEHDWCVYLQADEVLHENDLPIIRESIQRASRESSVEALVFQYRHFYGSFNVIQETRSAYRREMRVIRKSSGARSVGDAQSFRKPDGSKLRAILTSARIFHYGWVRTPEAMKEKTVFMDQLYHGDQKEGQTVPHSGTNYLYKRFWGLREYQGTHPLVMANRIREKGWVWNLKESPFVFHSSDIKKVMLDLYERVTGKRLFEFKNYELLELKK
jgi:glycosyltransferase involved in cell wall biosynthesis